MYKLKMIKIVTASSSNHFRSSIQFLRSVLKFDCDLVYYDIGLTNEEAIEIKKLFPVLKYKKFNFTGYPDHVRLEAPCAGAYAWKPIILSLESHFNGILIWCDSGNIVTSLDEVLLAIKGNAVYTPVSNGSILRWTHKDCLRIHPQFWNKKLRNAAFVGFDLENEITKEFIAKWKYYALQKEFIIPNGSNLQNHRFDQSILSLLFYEFNIREVNNYLGFTIHNDV